MLWQIRRDPRTLALLLGVPPMLLTLLRYVLDRRAQVFQHVGAPLCGLFPFIVMFIVTSIAMLRERTTGTLERLMTLRLAKLDVLAGYGIAFGVLAIIQALVISIVGFPILGLHAARGAWLIALLAIGNALLGMALGLFASAFARTEFEAVQFMPALVLPQLLLCGLFVERDNMAPLLHTVSWAMPLTYAYDALRRAAAPAALSGAWEVDLGVIIGATVALLGLGAMTLRRRTA